MPERQSFQRHEDDQGVDEILFVAPVPGTIVPQNVDEAQRHAVLRIALIERYKTSGLSGDEWRFSTGLYRREDADAEWELISTEATLDSMCAALYPSLYGDFQSMKWGHEFFKQKIGAIAFSWKGHPIWSASYEGEALDLMVSVGHAPWAWLQACGQGCDPSPLKELCCQPGCVSPLVSVYQLQHRYCREGHKSEASHSYTKHNEEKTVVSDVRGFCAKHLRRGDCGLDDADENYVVLRGPGPDGHEPDPLVVKEALRAPPIHISPEDLDA